MVRELWAARKEPQSTSSREVLAYFESVWEGGLWAARKERVLPHSPPHTRGLILSASDGIWNMLFSTYSHTSHLLYCCFHCVLRLCDCLLCHGSGEVFAPIVSLFLNSLTMGTAAEVVASDILVGAQPRIRCWARTRSSSSELVDTATARRQQRVEDATRVGLQFPFRQERRGRGAPSVAMKWRDAVKAAIMHGPLPPDVTLDAPHWWQPGMPLLPPADHRAPVPLKRKRVTSAEPKTDPAKRAYMRIPDEAKLWFVDFHAYQARVHGKTLAYNIRRAKQLVPELFGPVAPDTFRRWHDGGAPDLRGRPPLELPPFALSRLANLTHAVARLSLSVPTWQHVYRRVLRELDIEFEPTRRLDAAVSAQPAALMETRGDLHPPQAERG